MNMENTWVKKEFEQMQSALSDSAGKGFAKYKTEAYRAFLANGFPSKGNEDWKYTNLQKFSSKEFQIRKEQKGTFKLSTEIFKLASHCAVFINGHFSKELSKLDKLPKGLKITTIDSLKDHCPDHFCNSSSYLDRSFEALNTALFQEGIYIEVARNVEITEAFNIVFVSSSESNSAPVATFPRVAIRCAENSRMNLMETYLSEDSETYLTNAVVEFDLGQGSSLEHTKLGFENFQTNHFYNANYCLADSSKLISRMVSFGGGLVRNELNPKLSGQGIECSLNGLTILGGEQHVDNHILVNHLKPNCQSNQTFKGVYGDSSKGVFSGTIVVDQQAQKTNAFQANNSLLLSELATIDSRPQLKIWADDVKCTHGATVGQLDETALFYLKSRGISAIEARKILIHAFCSDVLSDITSPLLKDYLQETLHNKLEQLS
jgi:Fe-S cluster assembly protein SufD